MLLLLIGCGDLGSFEHPLPFWGNGGDFDAPSEPEESEPGLSELPAEPSFAVYWSTHEVVLSIKDAAPDDTFWFGMAETDCGGPAFCWTGEDCATGQPEHLYCHPASSEGVALGYSRYGDVSEGEETAFSGPGDADAITHYVESAAGECWVWGHDPSHYADRDCAVLSHSAIGSPDPDPAHNPYETFEGTLELDEPGCRLYWSAQGTPVPVIAPECEDCAFLFDVVHTLLPESIDDGSCPDPDLDGRYAYSTDADGYGVSWVRVDEHAYTRKGRASFSGGQLSYDHEEGGAVFSGQATVQ